MAKVEKTPERANWLNALQVGDPVKLETLMGFHRARIQKSNKGVMTVKITDAQDAILNGWELRILEDTGIGEWPYNIVHPIDAEEPRVGQGVGQDELILESIGGDPKDSPLFGWESA